MPPSKARSPHHRCDGDGAPAKVGLGSRSDTRSHTKRSPRRQQLVRHLCSCGERPVFEALLAVESGQSLDSVLEGFARLAPETYEALGADRLPIDDIIIIDGGKP
jgi:hypothetical protein